MPSQGKKSGNAKGTLYVLSLEIEVGHLAGGTVTVITVQSVLDANAGGQTL